MEEEIWSRLPLELVMVVLACLPYPSLARFKSVCKLWNSLPSTAGFQQLCKHLPLPLRQDCSYLLFFDGYKSQDICVSYDPTTGRWHKIRLKFPKESESLYSVRAANGGLYCVTAEDKGLWIVCNPVLNSSRQLPALPHNNSTRFLNVNMVNMIVDRCSTPTRSLSYSRRRWRTDIYDSFCKCWTKTGKMPTEGVAYCSGSVICGRTLFALFMERGYSLIACDIGRGVWTEVAVQMPDSGGLGSVVCPRSLVESEGRLLLAGVVAPRDDPLAICRSIFYVWELKVSTKTVEWLEIARTSLGNIYTELTVVSHDNLIFIARTELARAGFAMIYAEFKVVSHDNLIFMWRRICPHGDEVVVVYDIKQHTWTCRGFLPRQLRNRAKEDCKSGIMGLVSSLSLGAKV